MLPLVALVDALIINTTQLDPPTVTSLGVQVLIAGDDDFDASITLQYRLTGTSDWHPALSLWRVHPEDVPTRAVPPSFAGSVFGLRPATDYDLQLHALDPDGVDQYWTIRATTAAVPADPMTPHAVAVSDATSLQTALAAAQPGDVITLADGVYSGTFAVNASGTADQPIVIRGASEDGAILDGGGCTGCNVLEVYGSDVHVERMTIRDAERAIRFQGAGTSGNVVRRVHISDVTLGIGGKDDQTAFYLCDNLVEGRLQWPLTYGDDGAAHASDDGIVILGSGHTVCHNQISGFADALQNAQPGARANDFIGNDIRWTYDDGVELDGMEGNARVLGNRFLNTYDTISTQPVYGGPAYVIRNVVVNVANEQLKLHALGGATPQAPVGVLVFHNTFVRPAHAFQLSTPDAVRWYVLGDNLFIGPPGPDGGLTCMWDTPIDLQTGFVDHDGWYPDGQFEVGYGATGGTYASFAAMQAGTSLFEPHGTLLATVPFTISDHTPLVAPMAMEVPTGAIDQGIAVADVDDDFLGAAPDLGAIEEGCDPPSYGPRPEGVDESNEPQGCTAPVDVDGDDIGAPPDGGCCNSGGDGSLVLALLSFLGMWRSRRG